MSDEDPNEEIEESLLLNNPHTAKELDHGQSFAFGGMQGWRKSNEDYHKHLIPIDNHSFKLWSYFAIFDGHNGIDTAKNASHLLDKHLVNVLNKMVNNSDGKEKKEDKPIHSSQIDLNKLTDLIKDTFLQLDEELKSVVKDQSGAVSIVSLIGPENIYLINLGDSRAIVISNDGQVLAFTKDHKPSVRKEQERILKAGGRITQYEDDVLRVQDQLAVTRALGDYSLDKHIISASPDIIEYSKQSSASFIILACDGIWDVMSNEQVATFVSKRVSNTSLENIASQLLDHCLKLDTTDNMSIYIIKL